MKKSIIFVFLVISGPMVGMELSDTIKNVGVKTKFTGEEWQNFEEINFAKILQRDPAMFFVDNLDAEDSKAVKKLNGYEKQNFKDNWLLSNRMLGGVNTKNSTYVDVCIQKSPIAELLTCNNDELEDGKNYIQKQREQKKWKTENPWLATGYEYTNKWYIKYPAIIAGAFGLGWFMNSNSDCFSKLFEKIK